MSGWPLPSGTPVLPLVLAIYALASVVTFVVYALDKRAARAGGPRWCESTLHALEGLGGWPGALLAQQLIRHKNAKPSYQAVFWLVVAAHVVAWIVILRGV